MKSISAYMNSKTNRISQIKSGDKPNQYLTHRSTKRFYLDWWRRTQSGQVMKWIRFR